MKITIDDTEKTIRINETVKLSEFLAFIKILDLNPEEYSLIGTEIIYTHSHPISYPIITPCPLPNPYLPPWTIVC